MLILALDISTNTGYALLQSDGAYPVLYGNIWNDEPVHSFGEYPWSYLRAAESIAKKISGLAVQHNPDKIVIEETNKSKARYTQKILEFIHCSVLKEFAGTKFEGNIAYISTSIWRRQVGIELTKEQKKANAKLSKAKSKAGGKLTYEQKKTLGLKGKTTKKHVAVISVNERFDLKLKQKDNDIAEAILLGLAYLQGAPICDGK